MKWSEKVTFEFVKMYLKNECLWNPAHPSYKLKFKREKAYSDISREFKEATNKSLSNLEVKLKIKNLRTTYAQQVHKILEKSSPGCVYEPSLIWFHEMDRYLKNISMSRLSIERDSLSYSNSQENSEVDSSCQIWVEQHVAASNSEEVQPDPLIPQTVEMESANADEILNIVKREDRLSPVPLKKFKKKKPKLKYSSRDYNTDSNSECNPKDCSDSKEDEFDIYGRYIASQLRKMNLHKALRLQLEIQNLVSEARLSEMSD